MTPLQGEPPKIDFKLPKKFKKWLTAFRQFCIEIQPIGPFVKKQTVKGRWINAAGTEDEAASGAIAPFRLQILNASASGVGKARVRLGKIAGKVADPGMTDPGDDPTYIITFGSSAGWKYIYAAVTVEYATDEGTWSATACAITHTATIPSNSATKIYVEIGQVKLEAVTGGYAITNIIQTAPGDMWVARISGETSPFIDASGH